MSKMTKEEAIAAVQKDGSALQRVSRDLPGYQEVVMAAVQQNLADLSYSSTQYVAQDLPDWLKIVIDGAQKNIEPLESGALRYVPQDLPYYKEVVMAAVQQNGLALRCVPQDLPYYKEVAMAAVRQNGLALRHVSKDFPYYKEVALAAVQNNTPSPKTWFFDVKQTIDSDQQDKKVEITAVQENTPDLENWALQYAPQDLLYYKELAIAAVQRNGLALRCVAKDFYKDVAFEVIAQNPDAFKFAEDLSNNEEFCFAMVHQNPAALKYVKCMNEEIAIKAVSRDGLAIEHVPIHLPCYPKVAMAAVMQNPDAIEHIPKYLADYEAIALAAQERQQREELTAKVLQTPESGASVQLSSDHSVLSQAASVFKSNQSAKSSQVPAVGGVGGRSRSFGK